MLGASALREAEKGLPMRQTEKSGKKILENFRPLEPAELDPYITMDRSCTCM